MGVLREPQLARSAGTRAQRPDDEAARHDPDGLADGRPARRLLAGRLPALPQLRAALGSGLDSAFSELKAGGATELVLDLRYNGGGLVSVAQHLAGLIAGSARAGEVFVQFTHNDRQSSRNSAYRFEALPQALGVQRLVVITTRGSASASEAVINGLRPYMDVKLVGDRTYGKPVGQYGFNFCDKVLYPVCFLVTNARGEADFFGGIPADCAAGDDVDHPLASPSEASLAEALYVVRNGHCSGVAAAAATAQDAPARGATSASCGWTAGAGRSTPGSAHQLRGRSPSSTSRLSTGRTCSRSSAPTDAR